ncbi:MAG TPA: glycosyltransferase family A protein [Phycisphaerae bacterium]|nr:glycosyltransferase family A protein [Phycisphaerae bacterium]
MSPLVSVIITTYNRGAAIRQTIDSVLAQTLKDFQIIVVDDGSTDDTPEVLRGYGDKIQVIRQPNAWTGAARNRGIDAARGKYIAPLDHDDVWLSDKLQVQTDYYEKHPELAIVTAKFAYLGSAALTMDDFSRAVDANGIIRDPLALLASGSTFLSTSSAMMFNRERLGAIRYGETRCAIEDVSLYLQLLAHGGVGLCSPEILVHYHRHDANISADAEYWYNGMLWLWQCQTAGLFGMNSPAADRLVDAYLAHLGRIAVRKQYRAGQRGRACQLYFQDWPRQVRNGKWRYLALFPIMATLGPHI